MNTNGFTESIAVLIPCYNCGMAVVDVAQGVRAYTNTILTVNDGSTDETPNAIEQCQTPTLGWEKNRGKGAALIAGFEYFLKQTGWEALITMDSDGQHSPLDLPAFLDCYRSTQADMIVGRRMFHAACVPAHRRLANQLSSRLISLITQCPLHDIQCGYRLIRRSALENLLPLISSCDYAIETEMLLLGLDLNLHLAEVEIQCIYSDDSSRRSSWRPLKDSWNIGRVVARHLFSNSAKKALVNRESS